MNNLLLTLALSDCGWLIILATCVHSTLVCLCFIPALVILVACSIPRMSVQSFLIAYFGRCVQCTGISVKLIDLLVKMGFINLPGQNVVVSVGKQLFPVCTYRKNLAVTLINSAPLRL